MARVIVRSGGEPYRQEIEADGHKWLADEPQRDGGLDSGPTPYQLLLSAIGSCMSITSQMYARRKAWPLQAVEVSVEGENRAGTYEVTVSVRFDGPLTAEQRERLTEIAGRCPVKKSLSQPIVFRTVA